MAVNAPQQATPSRTRTLHWLRAGRLTSAARFALPAGFLLFCIVAWELATIVFSVEPYTLPPPTAIAERIVDDWSTISPHVWITLQETIIGFLAGAVIGIALGIVIASSRLIERTIYPLLVASQAVPKLAIAPLLVVWFGYGMLPKIIVIVLLVFFPVAVTTAQGLKSVDRNLLELLRSVNATPSQTFFKVKLPQALPQIMAGLEIGITLAVVGVVVGEWVGAQKGLGYLIIAANGQLDTTLAFAAVTLLVIMGIALFSLLAAVQRLVLPWSRNDG